MLIYLKIFLQELREMQIPKVINVYYQRKIDSMKRWSVKHQLKIDSMKQWSIQPWQQNWCNEAFKASSHYFIASSLQCFWCPAMNENEFTLLQPVILHCCQLAEMSASAETLINVCLLLINRSCVGTGRKFPQDPAKVDGLQTVLIQLTDSPPPC